MAPKALFGAPHALTRSIFTRSRSYSHTSSTDTWSKSSYGREGRALRVHDARSATAAYHGM